MSGAKKLSGNAKAEDDWYDVFGANSHVGA